MNALVLALAVTLAADPAGPRGDVPLDTAPKQVCFTPAEVVDMGAGVAGLTAERDALRSRPPLWVVVVVGVAAVVVAGAVGVAAGHELKGATR